MRETYTAWLQQNFPAAIKATAGTGIFPEVLLSQAIIESAKAGKMPGTILAREHNNYFGIKAGKKYTGKVVNMVTGEFSPAGAYYKEPANFRAYNSPADSFADYVKLLQNKRYEAVRAATTAEAQAHALQAAGYSTAPTYGETIAALATTIKNAAGALVSKARTTSGKIAGATAAAVIAVLLLNYSKAKK